MLHLIDDLWACFPPDIYAVHLPNMILKLKDLITSKHSIVSNAHDIPTRASIMPTYHDTKPVLDFGIATELNVHDLRWRCGSSGLSLRQL
jgi:hypothetical protein